MEAPEKQEERINPSKDAEVMLKLGSTPDKHEQHRLTRDAMEKRFVRVTRGSIIGGVCLGMFTATSCGLQNFFAEKQGVHDVYNVVTAATFGLIMPGSLSWRARNVVLGSVLGAVFGLPIGWLHLKLVGKANDGKLASTSEVSDSTNSNGGVGGATEKIEENLNN